MYVNGLVHHKNRSLIVGMVLLASSIIFIVSGCCALVSVLSFGLGFSPPIWSLYKLWQRRLSHDFKYGCTSVVYCWLTLYRLRVASCPWWSSGCVIECTNRCCSVSCFSSPSCSQTLLFSSLKSHLARGTTENNGRPCGSSILSKTYRR